MLTTFGARPLSGTMTRAVGVMVVDQLAADAAGRDHRDLAGFTGLGVTHGDDGFNAVVAVSVMARPMAIASAQTAIRPI